jgi:hypothetical protein
MKMRQAYKLQQFVRIVSLVQLNRSEPLYCAGRDTLERILKLVYHQTRKRRVFGAIVTAIILKGDG